MQKGASGDIRRLPGPVGQHCSTGKFVQMPTLANFGNVQLRLAVIAFILSLTT